MGWGDMLDAMKTAVGVAAPAGIDPEAVQLAKAFRGGHPARAYTADVDLPVSRAILDAEPERRAAIVVALMGGPHHYPSQDMVVRLMRSKLPFTDDQLVRMVTIHRKSAREMPNGSLVSLLERRAEAPLPDELIAALKQWSAKLSDQMYAEDRTAAGRILRILAPRDVDGVRNPFDPADPWGLAAHGWFAGLDPDERVAWSGLLEHASGARSKARPTRTWETASGPLLEAVGAEAFTGQLVSWLDAVDFKPGRFDEVGPSDANTVVLKGLIWFAMHLDDSDLAAALGRFGVKAFKKIPGHGAGSTKLGNAVVATLGAMAGGAGVAQLTHLRTKVRYASARRQIEKALEDACTRTGHSRADIEEIAIPRFGLGPDGSKRVGLAGFQAEMSLSGHAVTLGWIKPNGKRQKTIPKAAKETDPEGLKALKAERKSLREVAATQAVRVEKHWLTGRVLALDSLRARYLDHPVVGQTARRLLWRLEPENGPAVTGLWHGGTLADLGGRPIDLPDDTPARLWHPLFESDTTIQLVWRDRIEALGIEQPFSQVWREVYRASDEPGAAVSGRFARVLLDQRRLVDRAQRRGWRYTIQGHWDGWNAPVLAVRDLEVELQVDPIDHQADSHVYSYVVTGPLRIQTQEGVNLALADVDPLVFSEVLREVDGLVSSASAGARTAPAGFPDGYDWATLAFGPLTPLGHTRSRVLAGVLPRTTLKQAARIEGRWLVVDGREGRAEIHLGSAQVRVDGVAVRLDPGRKAVNAAKKAFLPFEGDPALPEILAKAHAWAG